MPISVQNTGSGANIIVKISGQFDFSLHQEFRESYRHVDTKGAAFKIDLSNATYMDSSALGMILLLKEHADKLSGSVTLSKPNESVSKILKIANFNEFLKIEP